MRRAALAIALLSTAVWAQPTVAPTDLPTGPPRGENTPGYNVRQSFELGYRFRTVDGNEGMYRSTVNFGNGVRLLGSSLNVQSREGHGGLFDQLLLTTQGLGNDPYQSANLRIEKNRLYRYDLMWRSVAYFNPGLRISNGQHFMDSTRHLQDQDLTIFPQSAIKFFLGYSRTSQSGPGLSTVNLFDATRGDEFGLFSNIQRQQNEHRLGTELNALGFRLNLMHAWVNFKEDAPLSLYGPVVGNNALNDDTTLRSFRRNEPYRGNSPYWRGTLFRESKYWAANGRFTYVSGNRAFVTDELSAGTNRLGNNVQRQVISFGDARRPAATGNVTLSVFPTSNVTITNQTSLYHIRMQGNSWYSQVDNNGRPFPLLNFEFLGIRTLSNSTDLEARLAKWLAVHAGYVYDTRRIRSVRGSETTDFPATAADRKPIEQNNRLNAGVLGFRIKPVRAFTLNLDAEIGRADNPFFTIGERNYHALRGRAEYKLRNVRIAAYTRTYYNTNSASLASFASRSRQEGVDVSWTPRALFSIDASYGKQHLDTLAALGYYAAIGSPRSELVSGDRSLYISNLHTGSLSARVNFKDRADLSFGMSIMQDTGDGRAAAIASVPQFVSAVPLQAAQTFPLRYLSPMGRFSVVVTPKIRWNVGYQAYSYREDFSTLQNFRADTGYTSLSWSF